MRPVAALLSLALFAASPEARYFRYQRSIENLPAHSSQACLALDARIFALSAADLADLRLFRDGAEVPYVLYQAPPLVSAKRFIELLNMGSRGGQTVFDAELPDGHVSDLELSVTAQDFIATVRLSGSQTQSGPAETDLGSYTIFDLSKQRLGRSTVLHLPEINFKYLHFRIAGPLAPDKVTGLSVLRIPEIKPRYVTVAETAQVLHDGHKSVVKMPLDGRIPVDRIAFTTGAQPAQFSRAVTIRVEPQKPSAEDASLDQSAQTNDGNLLRVHSQQSGHRIDEERLAIDAPHPGFAAPAQWTVTIDNGDDAPLKIDSVRFEMLERDLCFDAAGSGSYIVYYGDPALAAPRYDYATLFVPQSDAAKPALSPERANVAYQPRPDQRAFTERHPALLWIGLVLVIALLAAIAWSSLKRPGAFKS